MPRTVRLYGVRFDYKVTAADSGASLVKPRGTPDAMWNTAGGSARVLEIVAPAGLEDYFEELERTYGVKL